MGIHTGVNNYDRRTQSKFSQIQKERSRFKHVSMDRIQADTRIIDAIYRHGASRYRHMIQSVKNLVRMQGESFVAE